MTIESDGMPEASAEAGTLVEEPDAVREGSAAEREDDPDNTQGAVPDTPPRDVFDHWIFGDDPLWGVLGVAITGFAILWYFLHFAHLTTDIHRGYGDSAFDIGLYDQGVWLLSRF